MSDSSTGTARAPEGEPERPRVEEAAAEPEGAAPKRVATASSAMESVVVAATDPIAPEWHPGLPGVELSPISPDAIRAGKASASSAADYSWLPHMKTEFPPAASTARPMARRAGERLRHAADYLSRDTRATWADWQQFVADHPSQALAGALAAGFLFARLVRRL